MKKKLKKTNSCKNAKITASMTFSEILEKNPEAGRILLEEGLHCIGCHFSSLETLEQGAIMHGINPQKILKKLNTKKKKIQRKK